MSKNLKRAIPLILALGYLTTGNISFSQELKISDEKLVSTSTLVSEKINRLAKELREKNVLSSDLLVPKGEDLEKSLHLDNPLTVTQEKIPVPITLDVLKNEESTEENVFDLSLESALKIALDSNLSYKGIKENTKINKWLFFNSASELLPDISISNNLVYREGQSFFSPSSGVPINNRTNFISQGAVRGNLSPFSLFGSTAAYYDWLSTSSDQRTNAQELLRQTANQYYELIRARGELSVRMEAFQQARIQVNLNQKLKEGGVGTQFAVIQAQQQLSEFQLELLNQQAFARIAEIQLLTTLNLPLKYELRLSDKEIERAPLLNADVNSIDELINIAISKRPDITEKKFALKAAKHRVKQSFSTFTPTLVYSASSTGNNNSMAKSFDPTQADDFRNLTVGFDWTLLEGLGLGQVSQIGQRKAEQKRARIELLSKILEVQNEIRDSFVRINSAEQEIEAASQQIDSATEGIKLSRVRLKNGVGTNIDVIDSQRNYVNALINKVRSVVKFNQAHIDLLKATGQINLTTIIEENK